MSRVAHRVLIEAPVAKVWGALADVESWPAWASQFRRLERLDGGSLALGSRVRVRPRRLPASVWQVTEYVDGRLFTWTSGLLPGLRLSGGHELAPDGGATSAEFWLDAAGPLSVVLGPLLRRTVFRRNTRNATEGLKQFLEARQ
jgi:hypothetical protein